jgi:predicted nucleic acid-binding protein
MRPFTIDASVIVRAANSREAGSEEAECFIRSLGLQERPVIQPTLCQPEVASAVRRASGREDLAVAIALTLERLPGVISVPLDHALAGEAALLAATSGLRGADAVYAATACRFDAILVTLDEEQRRRLPASITACSPAEALALED